MTTRTRTRRATMYRQGRGWIVSMWDDAVQCYRTTGEMPYSIARSMCGEANRSRQAHKG